VKALGAALTILFAAWCVVAAAVTGKTDRWFEDITRQAGILHKHSNRVFVNKYAHIMSGYTALGAAVAVADYDGDGFEDIFTTDSSINGKNRLYRNNGDLTFTDVAVEAGVADGNDAHNATSDALWLDYNNDGRPDLLVVRFGQNQLYENLGGGKFREVTQQAGLVRYMNAITAIAFDYDHDGFVDLFVGSYFQPIDIFNPKTPRFFPESFETANNGGGVTVFHNNGNGTFTDVTEKVGLKTSGWVLDIGHADADNDGYDDLYVACDFGTDRFFVNNRDGTFTDKTQSAIGIDTKKGMNAEWGDFDNDGLLDEYTTNITDDYMKEGNFLWRNNGDLTFTDVASVTGTYDTGWGWGAKFVDYDNDSWLDLMVMNGWVSGASKRSYVPDIFRMIVKPNVDFADARNWPPIGVKTLSGFQRKKLFHNEGGQGFKDEAARHGVDSLRDGRGIAIADFDNDGRQDMFVTNANAAPYLYHNVQPTGNHWVQFLLEGVKSNRSGVGAQVRLTSHGKTLLRFVDGGNGFAGQSSMRVHFGLAEAREIDRVEIRWPSGLRQQLGQLECDRIYKVVEGRPHARFAPVASRGRASR
jgi:ASPIC and UnbV/FG-GAP-like repeat